MYPPDTDSRQEPLLELFSIGNETLFVSNKQTTLETYLPVGKSKLIHRTLLLIAQIN